VTESKGVANHPQPPTTSVDTTSQFTYSARHIPCDHVLTALIERSAGRRYPRSCDEVGYARRHEARRPSARGRSVTTSCKKSREGDASTRLIKGPWFCPLAVVDTFWERRSLCTSSHTAATRKLPVKGGVREEGEEGAMGATLGQLDNEGGEAW
jgi:hypothetical protein